MPQFDHPLPELKQPYITGDMRFNSSDDSLL